LLTAGTRRVVAPLHVVGDDESLTVQLLPTTLPPGTPRALVEAILPESAMLDEYLSSAWAGVQGAFVSIAQINGDHSVQLLVDLAYDVDAPVHEVPVFLSAKKGAAVGFLSSPPLISQELAAGQPWQGLLNLSDVVLVRVLDPEPPALVRGSLGWPGYSDIALKLLSPSGLDHEDADQGGMVWLADARPTLLAVSPLNDPGGTPSMVSITSLQGKTVPLPEPDDLEVQAFPLVADPCSAPFLGAGTIGGAGDRDRISLPDIGCSLVADLIARRLAGRAQSTPDSRLTLISTATTDVSFGWPAITDADPRLFVEAGPGGRQLVVDAELGTAGTYLVHLRRVDIIREISRDPLGAGPFIELEFQPKTVLDQFSVERVDGASGTVLASYWLGAQPLTNDGIIVLGTGSMGAIADVVHQVAELPEQGSFAIRLRHSGQVVDAVQLGGDGSFGEGTPLEDNGFAHFARSHGIDTNDNNFDFIPAGISTPGI
jgi:hypothetical protein